MIMVMTASRGSDERKDLGEHRKGSEYRDTQAQESRGLEIQVFGQSRRTQVFLSIALVLTQPLHFMGSPTPAPDVAIARTELDAVTFTPSMFIPEIQLCLVRACTAEKRQLFLKQLNKSTDY